MSGGAALPALLQLVFLSMASSSARTSVLPSGLPAGKCPFTGVLQARHSHPRELCA